MATWIDDTLLATCPIADTLQIIPVAKLFVFSLCFVFMFTCITLGVWAHYLARGETEYRRFASIPNLLKALSVKFDPTWSDLHAFGKSRLLRTTYFWIVFVPIVAKVFEAVKETLTVEFFNRTITVTLSLPFPWTMFFYGSVFAAFANTIYLWCCPDFLQKYPTFVEFAEDVGSPRQLSNDYGDAILRYRTNVKTHHFKRLVQSFWQHCVAPTENQRERIEAPTLEPWEASLLIVEAVVKDNELGSAFWLVRAFLDRQSEFARRACGTLFFAAFMCFIYIFAANIWYVISWQLKLYCEKTNG